MSLAMLVAVSYAMNIVFMLRWLKECSRLIRNAFLQEG